MYRGRTAEELIGMRTIATYLTGRRNLAGSGLALLAAALVLVDPVGPQGILLVIGFYLAGAVAVRGNPKVHRFGFDPMHVQRSLSRESGRRVRARSAGHHDADPADRVDHPLRDPAAARLPPARGARALPGRAHRARLLTHGGGGLFAPARRVRVLSRGHRLPGPG